MIPLSKLKELHKPLMEVDDRIFNQIMRGIYTSILQSGDQAIDVGANVGTHTIPMARLVAPEGQIFAFEPIDKNLDCLKENITKEELRSVVKIFKTALSNFIGEADFNYFDKTPGLSCFKVSPSYDLTQMDLEKRRVKVSTLDHLVPDKSSIRFIKCDAEGTDFLVLQGGEKILQSHRPIIIFEGWGHKKSLAQLYGYSKEEFFGFFKRLEYKLFNILGNPFPEDLWEALTMNDLLALPAENEQESLEIVRFSVIKTLSSISETQPTVIHSAPMKEQIGLKKSDIKKIVERLLQEQPSFHGTVNAGTKNYALSTEILNWIFVNLKAGSSTLETGCGYSTIIFALLECQHTVVSPYHQEHDLIKEWCTSQNIPLAELTFMPIPSQTMAGHLQQVKELDLVLVDGDRAFPILFFDWYLTADMLKKGGFLIIGYTQLVAGKFLEAYLLADTKRWLLIKKIGNAVIFKKREKGKVAQNIPWTLQPCITDHLTIEKRKKP